jgi:hypothetical protein
MRQSLLLPRLMSLVRTARQEELPWWILQHCIRR